jgi:alkylation response protein AidB-like acyl-CoA dehydrogenase
VTDFAEPDDRKAMREAVRRIASRFGHSYYVDAARGGRKTTELWNAMAEGGFLGVNLPEAYGGGGLGIAELAIVTEELAAQGCPLLLLVVSPAICGEILARFGTDAQKKTWLTGLATGRKKMVFALTEPDAGSNSHNLATTATRQADGSYRIRGQKYYITGVDEAEQMLVVVKTGTDARGRGRLSLFVVDTDAPGLKKTPIPVEMVASDRQFQLFFDDVPVGADRLVGPEGEGLKPLFLGLNPERIMGAAISIGTARYALDKACAYANSREVWGVPIGAHQGLSHPLAKAKIELELARLMTEKACWLYDQGRDAGEAANMAKYAAAEAALACVDQAIQVHGGNGFATEYGLLDVWAGARLARTAPVSREMILNFVAEHSLKLPRSY